MRLQLRRTRPDDLRGVARLERDPDVAPWLAEGGLRWHRAALADPDVRHLVAEHEGRLVAVLVLVAGPDRSLQVDRISVAPAVQRRGVGGALLRAARGHAAGVGAEHLFLDVARANVAARNVFRASGFRPPARKPGYVTATVPRDRVLLVHDLG